MNVNKKLTAVLLSLLLIFSASSAVVSTDAYADGARKTLIPGGMPFGVKLFMSGVMVVGVTEVDTLTGLKSPAKEAGFAPGDVIIKVDGVEVLGTEHLSEIFEKSDGNPLYVEINRENATLKLKVTPVKTQDGSYKTGLWVKSSTAGIGTVTYIDPENDIFGGLGHGICDGETGMLYPLKSGVVVDVNITGVEKGKVNRPGQLKGSFSPVKRGTLSQNTVRGVFGVINTSGMTLEAPMEIGYKNEVIPGDAYIITSANNVPTLYEAKIERISDFEGQTKNFVIKITDERLLELTGGIVQGMSGSPVIQNGRLVGAVTHVMIGDPTKGFGIFVENMLETSTSVEQLQNVA